MKIVKNRKSVEIYFILYLIALVLLLPDKKSPIGFQTNSTPQNAPIILEKNNLNFRFEIVNEKVIVRSFDSTNTIYIPSGLRNKEVQFIIEDAYTSEKVLFTTVSNIYSNVFVVKKIEEENKIFFQWKPIFEKNIRSRTLTVKVTVQETNSTTLREVLESQFSINIVNESEKNIRFTSNDSINRINPLLSTSILNPQQNYIFNNTKSNDQLILVPLEQVISASAGSVWKNKINSFGGGSLYSYSISAFTSNGNPVKILSIDSNSVQLQGIVPSIGENSITIRLRNKSNSDTVSASFKVRSMSLLQPEFQESIFADQKYVINPNFPSTEGLIASTLLKSEGRILEEKIGGNLYYSVNEDYIGKTIVIERYINNQKVNPDYYIKVLPFKNPQIEDIRKQNGSYIVTVEAFGKLSGKENKIDKIVSSTGEQVNFEEKFGNRIRENEKVRQILEIPFQRNTNFPHSIKVIDLRGNSSELRTLP